MMKKSNIEVKVKKLVAEATLPSRTHAEDACWDLVAVADGILDPSGRFIEYSTGLSIEPPKGYHVDIRPRSSISKYDLLMCNAPGTGDNNYRGEYKIRFKVIPPTGLKDASTPILYTKGDKIAQIRLIQSPQFSIIEVDNLSDTTRGVGGFGSTGK